MQEVTGSNQMEVSSTRVNGTPVWQKRSNTYGFMVKSKPSTWRVYGTKAQRKAFRKGDKSGRHDAVVQRGAAKLLGFALSHIYARPVN